MRSALNVKAVEQHELVTIRSKNGTETIRFALHVNSDGLTKVTVQFASSFGSQMTYISI